MHIDRVSYGDLLTSRARCRFRFGRTDGRLRNSEPISKESRRVSLSGIDGLANKLHLTSTTVPRLKYLWDRQVHSPMTNEGSRRRPPRVVVRDGNRIRFIGRVNPFAHSQFMWCLHDCKERGYADVVLDFTSCEAAFPSGMLPLLASIDALRREKFEVSLTLPESERLGRLFLNTNWAHFLDPERFENSDAVHDRHLAAQRFRDSDQQQQLVNTFMDVVMRNMTLDRSVIAGLEWSINEITDNVLNHADCEEGGIIQVSTFRDSHKVAFGVADSGQGILSSLREGHPNLQTDAQAIHEAMKVGITRNPENGQGNGIAGALSIATMSKGSFEITSGLAQIVVRTNPGDGTLDPREYKRRPPQRFCGTVVYAELGLDTRFQLSEALGLGGDPHEPVDVIELFYETEAGDAVVLRLREESTGFGSRTAGQQLRTKCINLLNAEPTKPLLLDWKDIPLISSSFADELVGKLFASLGPLAFSARVRNLNMNATVRGLIDKAIMQRVAQVANGATVESDARENGA